MKALQRNLAYLGALLARPALFALYFLSGFVPRRPDLWVFGSWGGRRFADNAAAFFVYCQDEIASSVRLVWISREKDIVRRLRSDGYEAYHTWSARGLASCLRAGVYLFDNFCKDVNFWTSRSARKVNLWSGVPLKTVERDIDNPRSRYYRLFHGTLPERAALSIMMPWHVERPDLIIATSSETARVTQRAFALEPEAVAITGYPRNDILSRRSSIEPDVRRNWPDSFRKAVEAGRFVFFYLPTYRDSGKSFLDVDWQEVDRLMRRRNGSFFLKLHPDDRSALQASGEHVAELPQGIDIYSLLPATDVLISDYSSIIFDYMLQEKPIIHYLPDLDEFRTSSRSLTFDPTEIAVGPVCETGPELIQALADLLEGVETDAGARARWAATRRRMNLHRDGASSLRVLAAIRDRFPDLWPGQTMESEPAR
ncbi:MAG: CDP-glycerol glycerophosphotransferase family protein [Gemmatimonadota bacterium]|jgi:CDP-glycerol glycerophosphotransferase (TagB/SpsB family)